MALAYVVEYDPAAGVWRWSHTARDGVYREGTAPTEREADIAARRALPKPLPTKITPPGYELRNRGRKR